MLGLSANLNYYLFNGNVDLRKGIFRLCESIREEMSLDPSGKGKACGRHFHKHDGASLEKSWRYLLS